MKGTSLLIKKEDDFEKEFLITGNSTLDSILSKAKEIQDCCRDFRINDVGKLTFDSESLSIAIPVKRKLSLKKMTLSSTTEDFGFTKYSFSQLCNKIGVPYRYILDKCIGGGFTDLAAQNVNHWLSQYKSGLMFRTYKDHVRGVLSNLYMTLDTPIILDTLISCMDMSQYRVSGYYISPERVHLRLIQNNRIPIEGEDLFYGIQVDSSDVGRSTLIVQVFVFKQVCTNGLCLPQSSGVLFKQRHLGVDQIDFKSLFTDCIKKVSVVMDESSSIIKGSVSDSTRIFEPGSDIDEFISRYSKVTHLEEEVISKAVQVIQQGKYNPTKWGFINSLTEVAQEYTLETRLNIEKVAGDLLVA